MTTESVTIGNLTFDWYNYTEPLQILNASDINNAYSNINNIRSVLNSKGYDVDELQNVTASYNSQLIEIVDILNGIEYNLDVINNTDVKSIYYDKNFRVVAGKRGHNTAEIWRWFQVLNDILEIVKGDKGKWSYLLCTDGYPTINGKRIVLRGDYIG